MLAALGARAARPLLGERVKCARAAARRYNARHGLLTLRNRRPTARKRELARLIGVEDHMFVEVEGQARVYAIADEDLDRENDEKTSAVHFVRFELKPPMIAAVKAGASVKLGCDHRNYPAHVTIGPDTLASLAGDLR